MDQVILDLGSDATAQLKQTWERMGRNAMQWSPVYLRMEKPTKDIPMGHLYGVTVDIEGVSITDDF